MAVTTSHEDAVGTQTTEMRTAAAAEALLLDVVRRNADELLRVAQAHSLCLDDAHDAYQRSLEQFLRHGRRLRSETAERWLFTVVKHEAGAVRRARSELVAFEDLDFERVEARGEASPEERALAAEAVARSAEALRALKPQELRALWLQAGGSSYAEIQRSTGWSYTKVNRCLAEGRRAFLRRCAELETGAECERWSGVLAAIVAGEAGAEELTALRPHLRGCGSCRATLRALHASSESMAIVLPPGLVGLAVGEAHGGAERLQAAGRWLAGLYEAAAGPVQERAAASALKWQAAAEAMATGKLTAVAASTVALAGSGAVIAHDAVRPARQSAERPAALAGSARDGVTSVPDARLPRGAVPGTLRRVALRSVAAASFKDVNDSHALAARREARPAAPGSPGAREFGVEPVGPAPANNEFAQALQRPRRPTGTSARPARPRAAAPVVRAATLTARTDFPATPTGRAAWRPAPSRPAAASPALSEFGP